MKKIIVICICLFTISGCSKKPPSVCTDALTKAEEAISNFQNSKKIPNEYKPQPIANFRANQTTISNAMNDKSLKEDQLISVCEGVDKDITRRISNFNY